MAVKVENVFINGISSDIGFSYAARASNQGCRVFGTFRQLNSSLSTLNLNGGKLFQNDILENEGGSQNFTNIIEEINDRIDFALIAVGTMAPLGKFHSTKFSEWKSSFDINLFGPLDFIHTLLNSSNERPKTVVFLAGGGIGSAPINLSAYVTAKLALTKVTELLAAEYQDVNFTIIGPGWVKTKIHEETLGSTSLTSKEKSETKRRILQNDFVPMESVLNCIDWVRNSKQSLTSGRNFSVVHDIWSSEKLDAELAADPMLFKVRRKENNKK